MDQCIYYYLQLETKCCLLKILKSDASPFSSNSASKLESLEHFKSSEIYLHLKGHEKPETNYNLLAKYGFFNATGAPLSAVGCWPHKTTC